MKLKNKKTGEIAEVESCNSYTGTIGLFFAEGRECDRAYNSLAELNEEWEDYEEPRRHWFISGTKVYEENGYSDEGIASLESVGNHFETKEEAKKAVEKLRAWKRLKDKGFRFGGVSLANQCIHYRLYTENDYLTADEFKKASNELYKDLELLFGEEEE